ncbi:MAG: hypothetical protein AB7E95_00960 [Kiritimatiellales bacterium]
MAKSRFNIKGTKDFLVMAVFCGFVCIWSIRDAWFPTQKIREKHPQEIDVAFEVPGVIQHISVEVGQEIAGKTVLAVLHDDSYRVRAQEAEAAFEAAKAARSDDVEDKLAAMMKAREELAACTIENTDIIWKSSHGEEPLRGTVSRIIAKPATQVDVGEPVLAISPHDSFYLFNKTLAVIMFLGTIIGLIFHRVASK